MSEVQKAAQKLPSDPNYALLVFADAVYKSYVQTGGNLSDDDAVFAIRFIDKFVKKFGVKCSIAIPPGGKASQNALNVVEQIRNQRSYLSANIVDVSVDEILNGYASGQDETFGLAKLNSEEKRKIVEHLENVRKLIEESSIADRKKNALFEKLVELLREVNTHGTRTDRFFAFAGDVGFVLGDMAKKAKPLMSEVKEILKIVSRSRARQEGISLPAGDEVLQLAAPDGNEAESGTE